MGHGSKKMPGARPARARRANVLGHRGRLQPVLMQPTPPVIRQNAAGGGGGLACHLGGGGLAGGWGSLAQGLGIRVGGGGGHTTITHTHTHPDAVGSTSQVVWGGRGRTPVGQCPGLQPPELTAMSTPQTGNVNGAQTPKPTQTGPAIHGDGPLVHHMACARTSHQTTPTAKGTALARELPTGGLRGRAA